MKSGWYACTDWARDDETIKAREAEEAQYPKSNQGLWSYTCNSSLGESLGLDDKSVAKREAEAANAPDEKPGLFGSLWNTVKSGWYACTDWARDEETIKAREAEQAKRPLSNKGLGDYISNSATGRFFGLDDKTAETEAKMPEKDRRSWYEHAWDNTKEGASKAWDATTGLFKSDEDEKNKDGKDKSKNAKDGKGDKETNGKGDKETNGKGDKETNGKGDKETTPKTTDGKGKDTPAATQAAPVKPGDRVEAPKIAPRTKWEDKDNAKATKEVEAAIEKGTVNKDFIAKIKEQAAAKGLNPEEMAYKALKMTQLTSKSEQQEHGLVDKDGNVNLDNLQKGFSANGICMLAIEGTENLASFHHAGQSR